MSWYRAKAGSQEPFEPAVRDGRVYGRGTYDMKGGIASSVIALESLLEEGIHFSGAIEFSGTVDEETGGYGEWLFSPGTVSFQNPG